MNCCDTIMRSVVIGHHWCTERHLLNKANVNSSDALDMTLLHLSASNGDVNCMELLLKYGANVNAKNVFGITPLYCAAMRKRLDCVRILLENGSDMSVSVGGKTAYDISDENGKKIFDDYTMIKEPAYL